MLTRQEQEEYIALLERELRAKAKDDLGYYVRATMDLTPAAHHELLIHEGLHQIEADEIDILIVCMPPGSAKALALDTPIPTPNGWKQMGDLRVGDQVFDEHGRPCSVTWVSPTWKDRPVYKVRTDCGDEIIADRDHEWLVRLCSKRPVFKIKETHELSRKRSKRPMIQRAAPLVMPPVDLPIDPYVLGVWLGDGHASGLRITSAVDDQEWLREELSRLGYFSSHQSTETQFGLPGHRGKFVELGLLHDPAHATYGKKHIPEAYMRASVEQRTALLQGLIDTDGTVCKDKGCTTFCNTNRELAEQVRELVRSLGVKAGWSETPAVVNGKVCGTAYRVSFYMADSARMPRKRQLCRDQYRTPDTYIDVEPHGYADTVCIEVDSPSHLFLCGRSMTPTHNSTYSSVAFPAWYLGRHPTHCIIAASHTQELAERFGRRVRNIVGSPEHASIFPEGGLSSDSTAAGRWDTAKKGEYFAAGVGGSITGRRADCLPGHTLVDTARGTIRLDAVVIGDQVVSYAEQEHRSGYRRVAAVARRRAEGYWRIRTASGRVVEATGNHRIYVGGVWKTAETIAVGDILMSLRHSNAAAGVRAFEEGQGQAGLPSDMQPELRNTCEQRSARYGVSADLSELRDTNGVLGQELAVFGGVQVGCLHPAGPEAAYGARAEMQRLRQDVQAAEQCLRVEDVLTGMRGRIACQPDVGAAQLELAQRCESESLPGRQRPEVSCGEEGRTGARQACLRGMPCDRQVAGTPHRHGLDAQRLGEPGNTLHAVSPGSACCGAAQTFRDPVAVVEYIREDDWVYDIEVEHDHNFFAGGVLVHNCAIIDDPVKSREDADSQTIRDKQWAWWRDDLMTRMKPGGKLVLIMTRWHEDDLAGRLLADVEKNGGKQRVKVISLPMEAEENDPLGRRPGEPLWPEWFTPQMIEVAKREPRTWSALYQQRPRPIGGGEFKEEWLNYWTRTPATGTKIILVDPASGKSKTRGDFTSMWVIGQGADGNDYVVDGIRDRLNLTGRTEALFRLVRRHRPAAVGYEEYGLQADIEHIKGEQEKQQYRFKIIPLGGKVKKEDRIRRLIPMFQDSKIWMPSSLIRVMSDGHQRDIMEDFKAEFKAFPVSAHDDAIDCLARSQEPEIRKFLNAPRDPIALPTISYGVLDSDAGY